MDLLSPEERSILMSKIRGKNTKPELLVRRLAHSLGYRFRLHSRDVPGVPDLVFRARRKVVFVHGCFWHRHAGCRFAYAPKTNSRFWQEKFESNVRRDKQVMCELRDAGWSPLVLWECELADPERVVIRLTDHLGRLH